MSKNWWPKSGGVRLSVIFGTGAAILYGVITRLYFGRLPQELATLSLSFLLLTPPVLGFLAVLFSPEELVSSWAFTIMAPWMPCLAVTIIAGIANWEAWFCILLGLPLFFFLASIGGLLARLAWKISRRFKGPSIGALLLVVMLPYLSAPFEARSGTSEATRTVHSSIAIAAPAEIVWLNITNLDPIQAEERSPAFFHLIGLPRPVEARMACQEVGCLRRGSWEYGLAFDGRITQIEPGVSYWVALEADTTAVQPGFAPLGEIGGPAFGMVNDGYKIEDLGDGTVRLHLYSTYRVRTGINGYAGIWLDFLLRDIQRHILGVEKLRCETRP